MMGRVRAAGKGWMEEESGGGDRGGGEGLKSVDWMLLRWEGGSGVERV